MRPSLSLPFTVLTRHPTEMINPLIPPVPVLLGIAGGVALLLIIGTVVAAVLLSRKR
jgi:hypothetical protein